MQAHAKFESVEDELKATKDLMNKQRARFENAENEIRDLQKEHNDEKEDLMITLRQQEFDIKFYKQIVNMVLKPEEITKLKTKSQYDDTVNEWDIPIFVLKARDVALPSLSGKKNAPTNDSAYDDELME